MEMTLQARIGEVLLIRIFGWVLGGDQQILSGGELKRLEVARALLFKSLFC